jgi:hypothetical protein
VLSQVDEGRPQRFAYLTNVDIASLKIARVATLAIGALH